MFFKATQMQTNTRNEKDFYFFFVHRVDYFLTDADKTTLQFFVLPCHGSAVEILLKFRNHKSRRVRPG